MDLSINLTTTALEVLRGVRVSTVVNDADQPAYAPLDNPSDKIAVSHAGFSFLMLGRPITSEKVAEPFWFINSATIP